jgi:hypothetical protein
MRNNLLKVQAARANRHAWRLLLWFCSYCAFSQAAPVLAAPLAILTDVSGNVQLVRGGKPTPGKNGAQLSAGDVVRVASGSATVYYVTRPPQKLKSRQQVKVAAANAPAGKPSLWANVVGGISSGFKRQTKENPGTVRNAAIRQMSPRGSRVTSRPTFYWGMVTLPQGVEINTVDYVVRVQDASVEDSLAAPLWETTTTEYSVAYPADAPVLEAGKTYKWDVEFRVLGQRHAENRNLFRWWPSFTVATDGELKQAKQETDEVSDATRRATDAQRRFFAASALAQRGFYADAVAQLLPEMVQTRVVAQGDSYKILASVVPHLDSPSRTLLRKLWDVTAQNDLTTRLLQKKAAPKKTALEESPQESSNRQAASDTAQPQ